MRYNIADSDPEPISLSGYYGAGTMSSLKIPKDDRRDDALDRLKSAVEERDACAFETILQTVDWENRPPADFLRAVRLALETGHYTLAGRIAAEGVKHHPRDQEIQRYALALAPPKIERKKVSSDPTIKANRDWLARHSTQYRGKWVGIRNGELLGSADSLDELIEEIGDEKNILMTAVY